MEGDPEILTALYTDVPGVYFEVKEDIMSEFDGGKNMKRGFSD
jgi:hypothetical protein